MQRMLNLFITIIAFIIFIVFGIKTLNDFGFAFQWKVGLPFGEFNKETEENKIPDSSTETKETEENKISDSSTETKENLLEIKKLNPILVKLTYNAPALIPHDTCNNGICQGEYILIGESLDTIRVDSIKCIEFKPESYHYDSGPLDPKTGTYVKIITDWQGTELRKCGWFDIPKNRIISKENLLYETHTKKQIPNYDTIDEFGSKIVK